MEHERPRNPGDNLACCTPELLSQQLAALSHPVRLEILRHLSSVETCCCKEVVKRVSLAQSTVSQHLKVLVEAGLICVTREGIRSKYAIDRGTIAALSTSISKYLGACVAGAAKDEER